VHLNNKLNNQHILTDSSRPYVRRPASGESMTSSVTDTTDYTSTLLFVLLHCIRVCVGFLITHNRTPTICWSPTNSRHRSWFSARRFSAFVIFEEWLADRVAALRGRWIDELVGAPAVLSKSPITDRQRPIRLTLGRQREKHILHVFSLTPTGRVVSNHSQSMSNCRCVTTDKEQK